MSEKIIWDYLLAAIENPHGAAGLMGNLQAESALNPRNLQNTFEKKLGMTDDSYTDAVDRGTYNRFDSDGAGYGLAQWTHSSRKLKLLFFTRSRQASIGDLAAQLDFLMEELRKIHRILLREAGNDRLETVLVLDAVLGQNSVAQAETFNSIIPITSIILTKYDNTAKGGVVISIARKLHIPVRYIGLGEGADDLNTFSPLDFANALMEVNP